MKYLVSISLLLALLLSPLPGGKSTGGFAIPADELTGIDVSHYQRRIDWGRLLENHELHFAFVKATEGATYVDSLFQYNWAALCQHELQRGAYHFFRANVSGMAQAQHFLRTAQLEYGDMAPVLDIETTDGMPIEVMQEAARTWLLTVERELGVRPIIYTNLNFYNRYLAGVFDHYPLWIARYSNRYPQIRNGRMWQFWQHSSEGRLHGIAHAVDLNRFIGSREQLQDFVIKPRNESAKTAAP